MTFGLILALLLGQPSAPDGYVIFWGTTPGVYNQSLTVVGWGTTQAEITQLQPGQRYYIVSKYFDYRGLLSPESNVVSGVAPASGRIQVLWDPPLLAVEAVRVGVE